MVHQFAFIYKMSQTSILIQILQRNTLRSQQFHTAIRLCAKYSSSESDSSDDEKKLSKKNTMSKPVEIDLSQKIKSLKSDVNVSVHPKKQRLPEIKTTETDDKALDKSLVNAIKNITANLQKNRQSQVESDLLTTVQSINKNKGSVSFENLSNIINNMKIEKNKSLEKKFGAKNLATSESKMRKQSFERRSKMDNYLQGNPLLIFSDVQKSCPQIPKMSTWELLEQLELKSIYAQPPRNVFQQLINWTEKGKLWNFPIDNEQGMVNEQSVHFSEHVFIDRHLKDWCPKSGPIRHFMELVCVGLSKNPYLTVEEKLEHLTWFKNYFNQHADLLKGVGVTVDKPKPKQLDV